MKDQSKSRELIIYQTVGGKAFIELFAENGKKGSQIKRTCENLGKIEQEKK